MTQYKWDTSYAVHVKQLDTDHKKLFLLTNTLFNAIQRKESADTLQELMEKLEDYSITHFEYEEALMEMHNVPDLVEQQQEHRKFVQKLHVFRQHYPDQPAATSLPMLRFLNEWFIKHISQLDKKYTPYLSEKLDK